MKLPTPAEIGSTTRFGIACRRIHDMDEQCVGIKRHVRPTRVFTMYIESRIGTQFGNRLAFEPQPASIPHKPVDALRFAQRMDRWADALLAEGQTRRADSLAHLALEARCKATGARA